MPTNPADTTYYAAPETVPGTTNTSPAFQEFGRAVGSGLDIDSDMLTSEVIKSNRGTAVARRTKTGVSGTLKTDARRDTTTDMFLESAFGGSFSGATLTAGNTDKFMTVEKKMLNGATPTYVRYTGVQASKFEFNVEASGKAEFSFDFVGMGNSTGTALIANSTYTAATQGAMIIGDEVASITLGGQTFDVASLSLSVAHNREPQYRLGSAAPRAIATSGSRDVKVTAKVFREDLSVYTLTQNDTPIAVSFIAGAGTNNRYTFTANACVASLPKEEESGASAFATVEFTAINDGTGVDVKVVKS